MFPSPKASARSTVSPEKTVTDAVSLESPVPSGAGAVAVANPAPDVAASMDRSAVSPLAPFSQNFSKVSVPERRALVKVQVIVVPAASEGGTVNDPSVTVTPLLQPNVVA